MPNQHNTPRPQLGVISDETGPSLDGCIAFAVEHGLDQIEIRMVDGIAPLSLTKAQASDANARIRAAGLTVAGIATPLLKWEAPGKNAADQGDQFGFSREGRSDDDLTLACIDLAGIFETRNLRIFYQRKKKRSLHCSSTGVVEFMCNSDNRNLFSNACYNFMVAQFKLCRQEISAHD